MLLHFFASSAQNASFVEFVVPQLPSLPGSDQALSSMAAWAENDIFLASKQSFEFTHVTKNSGGGYKNVQHNLAVTHLPLSIKYSEFYPIFTSSGKTTIQISDVTCEKCCPNGTPAWTTPADQQKCEDGRQACDKNINCDEGFEIFTQDSADNTKSHSNYAACLPKTCSCTNGKPASGHQCGKVIDFENDDTFCESCFDGYHLENKLDEYIGDTTRTCEANICHCYNGTPATGSTCKTHNSNFCSSCEDLSTPIDGYCINPCLKRMFDNAIYFKDKIELTYSKEHDYISYYMKDSNGAVGDHDDIRRYEKMHVIFNTTGIIEFKAELRDISSIINNGSGRNDVATIGWTTMSQSRETGWNQNEVWSGPHGSRNPFLSEKGCYPGFYCFYTFFRP